MGAIYHPRSHESPEPAALFIRDASVSLAHAGRRTLLPGTHQAIRFVAMSSLPLPFHPAWWARGPHAQTVMARALRSRISVPLRRERVLTPDGDFLDLDYGPDDDLESPRVLLLHGLEGSSRRGYCMESYGALARRGLAPIGMNFRSCSGEPNQRARAYHSGETGDLKWIVTRLLKEAPNRPLGVLGFSLGGNVLLKYLGELGPAGSNRIQAAVAVSVPYDLAAGSRHLERFGFHRVYVRKFLRSLRSKIRAKEHLVGDFVDIEAVERARTLWEFDELATAPLHGFQDAHHYYRESSSAQFLPEIRVPTLLLHSADDPFLPAAAIPREEMRLNPHLFPTLTPAGGHVGFLMGAPSRPRLWAEESAARFLAASLAGH